MLRNAVADRAPARWVGIRLVGKDHRDIVGSTVTLETGSRTLTRFAKGGGSYLSANDPRILFGLGTAGRPGRVTVKWSWGKTQTWDGLEAGSYWELREDEPAAKPRGPRRNAKIKSRRAECIYSPQVLSQRVESPRIPYFPNPLE